MLCLTLMTIMTTNVIMLYGDHRQIYHSVSFLCAHFLSSRLPGLTHILLFCQFVCAIVTKLQSFHNSPVISLLVIYILVFRYVTSCLDETIHDIVIFVTVNVYSWRRWRRPYHDLSNFFITLSRFSYMLPSVGYLLSV